MVEDDIEIFEKKENNNKLDTLAYIEMKKIEQYEKEILLAEEKTKQLNIEKEIKISEEKTKQAEQKTKQLQIELEILKIKPNQNKIEVKKIQINKNICPKTKKCMDCPTMITEKSTRCTPCVNKLRLKEAIINSKRPSYTQLKSDMDSLGSYIKVSKKYNVSDHTIRNWIKTYENKII